MTLCLIITIYSYLIVPFLSDLPQPKIICIIFSDLIRHRLALLGRRNILTIRQKTVIYNYPNFILKIFLTFFILATTFR